MPTEETTPSSTALNFRRLLAISVAAQIVMIVVVLIVGLVGGISMIRISGDLEARTTDVLLVRGIQNDFESSRLAVREYVNTGDELRLGPFTRSREEIKRILSELSTDLDPSLERRLDEYTDEIDVYLVVHGEDAIKLKQAGRDEEAREIASGAEAVRDVREIAADGRFIQDQLIKLQEEASDALRNRQIVNIGLIVAAGLLILATSLGVMLWLRREMLQPLEDLAEASRRLGHGDLAARVKPSGVDEILLASSAFNQMADEVQQHVQQLHELSAARTRFVSSVSHELRTPITSLRGYLEMLSEGEAGELSEEQLRYVQIAERNARMLDELINDLLTLSRVQSGKITLKPEPVDVRLLLRELKTEMLPVASEKKVDLVLVDTGDLVVSGEPLRLKQAFGNLIGNAVKYSPAGQAVVVRAFRVNRQAVISVVDWGPGIPKDELPQLAEPFFRASTTERIPGTGLGLPIAKQMIELHGGRLAVESEPGSGSTFTVYLPLRMPEPGEEFPPAEAPPSAASTMPGELVLDAAEPDVPRGDGAGEAMPDATRDDRASEAMPDISDPNEMQKWASAADPPSTAAERKRTLGRRRVDP